MTAAEVIAQALKAHLDGTVSCTAACREAWDKTPWPGRTAGSYHVPSAPQAAASPKR